MSESLKPLGEGLSKGLSRLIGERAVDWLISLVAARLPELQERTVANLEKFVVRLERRVALLEAELPLGEPSPIYDALSDPSCNLMIRKAATAAASTDNDDRHAILSELIAQRLTAGSDDMIALVGSAACDAVLALSTRHIRLLAILAATYSIRPLTPPTIADQDSYDLFLLQYLDNNLGRVCDESLRTATSLDFSHLVALGCLMMSPSFSEVSLNRVLLIGMPPEGFAVPLPKLQQRPWWSIFELVWSLGGKRASLTSTGTLIGVLHYDAMLGTRTEIPWGS